MVNAISILFPSDTPIHLVARKEHQVQPMVSGLGDVLTLPTTPVFVMSDGYVSAMLARCIKKEMSKTVSIHSSPIGNIVTIALQPTNQGVLSIERHVDSPIRSRGKRPVVRGLECTPRSVWGRRRSSMKLMLITRNAISVRTTPTIVGLPGGVQGLNEHVRTMVVIAHNEINMACPGFFQSIPAGTTEGAIGMLLDIQIRCLVPRNAWP
mmetsp:Transcript_33291/g.71354  ORF Transcript_33291/g.71354 Transcript_33291/m.71354 type:complete len:209 (-) Transcript_33291:547-1173(-)